ncbi:MAG: aromatic ring-hydroxylating oxygenase subunit alpha [Dehalococcoidia bacterium]
MEHDLEQRLRLRSMDPDFYALERQLLWPRQWLVAGRADELAGPGHYAMWEETGVPLIVIRSVDGELRCFYNSCRHRGAPVVREPRGRNRALRCQYHSWTYDTFGRLVSVPDERDFVDLRFEERSLVPVAAKVVAGWVLVNQSAPDAAAPDLPAQGGKQTLTTLRFEAQANWKTMLAALDASSGPDGAAAPVALGWNGLLVAQDASQLAVTVWPVAEWPGSADTCSIRVAVLAPEWDEDDGSPLESADWANQHQAITAWVAASAAIAEGWQRELTAGQLPSALQGVARHRQVDEAIGPHAVPTAWRVGA